MTTPELSSPVMRIAAVVGEEPMHILEAMTALVRDGMTYDELWKHVADGLMEGRVTGHLDQVFASRQGCLPFPYERTATS